MTIKIKHKRSAVSGKAPLPADLDFGEIAVNYHASGPAIYVKDTAGAIRKIGSLTGALAFKGSKAPGDAAPGTPAIGDVWVMSAAGKMAASWTGVAGLAVVKDETIAWDGSEWISLGSSPTTDATETAKGIVELATAAETTTGTDATRAVHPAGLTAALTFTQSGAGAKPRSHDSKLKDVVSVKDFGAVGDGVTDDTAAINAAEASSFARIFVPEGVYSTTLASFQAINKIYFGPGQIKFSGYSAAKIRSFVTSAQAVPSTDRTQLFDTLNKIPESYYRYVGSGVNPAVLPATYKNYPEWSQRVGVYDFAGGFNTDPLDHALGRSGAFAQVDRLYHGGQGDLIARNFYGEVYSSRPGATHFLANPALVVENGNLGVAGPSGAGCYLQHSEYIFNDGGQPVAAIDRVRNYIRTNAGNSLGQVWIHDRPQSSGTQPIDAFYSVAGLGKVGLDFTPAVLTADKAAIALKTGDRIYFEASSTPDSLGSCWYADTLGSTYITSGGGGFLSFFSNGTPNFQVGPSDVICLSSNGLQINSTGLLRFKGTGQYSTGSSTATFTAANKPGPSTNVGPSMWLKVDLGNQAFHIPCWPE